VAQAVVVRGDFASAVAVSDEAIRSCGEGDVLIVPRSFDWLLTVNHHDEIFAVYEPVSSRVTGRIRGRTPER
jgi:hypothetical protein